MNKVFMKDAMDELESSTEEVLAAMKIHFKQHLGLRDKVDKLKRQNKRLKKRLKKLG